MKFETNVKDSFFHSPLLGVPESLDHLSLPATQTPIRNVCLLAGLPQRIVGLGNGKCNQAPGRLFRTVMGRPPCSGLGYSGPLFPPLWRNCQLDCCYRPYLPRLLAAPALTWAPSMPGGPKKPRSPVSPCTHSIDALLLSSQCNLESVCTELA